MTADAILKELKSLGNEGTKAVLMRHGAREPFFGVKIEYLKKIQKQIKTDQALALALYDSGNSDAMYLAGLICDPQKMTKAYLNRWVKNAYWYMLAESTFAPAAAESPFAIELAQKWIESKKELIAVAGWTTLSHLASIAPDDELDLATIDGLLASVPIAITTAPNRVRYAMNGFVIAIGSCVIPLQNHAKTVAIGLGKVTVEMGDTDCKTPVAFDAIAKIEAMGRIGKKRKSALCK